MTRIFSIILILALASTCGEACDFSSERSCDEISHEIGQVAGEMGARRIAKASKTRYFKFRSQFDSKASMEMVDRYISHASPSLDRKSLESNYQVAVCEHGLNEEKVISLASEAESACGNDTTTECFRKFYGQRR